MDDKNSFMGYVHRATAAALLVPTLVVGGGLAGLVGPSPAIAADYGFGIEQIKKVVPDGNYTVVSYTPPDGVYKRFVYVLDKPGGPKGEIYMPFYVEKRSLSLEQVVEEIRQKAQSVDSSERIKIEEIKAKGQVVGYMVYTEGTRPQIWNGKEFYRVMLREQNFQAGGGDGGTGGGGAGAGGAGGAGGQ